MDNPLTMITSLGKSRLSNEVKGVVKRDWVPTGRIDLGRPCKFSAIPKKEAAPSSKNRFTDQLVMHSLGLTTRRSCLLPLYIF
jgi:hypothetical protein